MKRLIGIFALFGVLAFAAPRVQAQCPMCKAGVESTHNTKTSPLARGLNNGILMLFILPYTCLMLLGVSLYVIYRRRKKASEAEALESANAETENPSGDFSASTTAG